MKNGQALVIAGLILFTSGAAQAAGVVLTTAPVNVLAAGRIDCMIANIDPVRTLSVNIEVVNASTGAVHSGQPFEVPPNHAGTWGAAPTTIGYCRFTVTGTSRKRVRAHAVLGDNLYVVPAQ